MAQESFSLKIIHFQSVPSTQNVALSYLELAKNEDLLIIAEEQSASIGRKQNKWFSPKGGWWGTFVFCKKEEINQKQYAFLHYSIALGVRKAIETILSIPVKIKWPNDIILEKRKLGGILIDTVKDTNCNFLLVGIGINTNNKVLSLDSPVNSIAISINESLKIKVDNEKLTKELYKQIKNYIIKVLKNNLKEILKEFNSYDILCKNNIIYKNQEYTVEGIEDNGLLKIQNEKETLSLEIESSELIELK
ncbi:MAG: biotin--[acetyl-CoA-carboxylase] ligase [Candidatus Heimdallarchaeaceae archaeon]